MKSLHFGSAMIDIITLVAPEDIERATFSNREQSFLMLETGRKVPALSITSHVGGGACNTAISLARRGWDVDVLARVGDDLKAKEVRAHLDRNGANHRLVEGAEATGTSVMIASHDRNASIFVHRGANECLVVDDLPDFTGYDLVYIAPLSSRSADCFPEMARRGREANAMVAVNPGIRQLTSRGAPFMASIENVDLLSINRVEAEALVPLLEDVAQDAPMEIADPPVLLERGLLASGRRVGVVSFLRTILAAGPKWALITDGTDGAYLAGPDGIWWHPSVEVEAAGTAGAGDAFCSTSVAALMEGSDIPQAMLQAAISSASVVGHVDTTEGLLNRQSMEAALAREGSSRALRIA